MTDAQSNGRRYLDAANAAADRFTNQSAAAGVLFRSAAKWFSIAADTRAAAAATDRANQFNVPEDIDGGFVTGCYHEIVSRVALGEGRREEAVQGLGSAADALSASAWATMPHTLQRIALIHLDRAALMRELGRLDESIAEYATTIDSYAPIPDTGAIVARCRLNRAEMMRELGRLADAANELTVLQESQQAGDGIPEIRAMALMERGVTLIAMGQPEIGIWDLDAAINAYATMGPAADRAIASCRGNRAIALRKIGRLQEALADCDAVVRALTGVDGAQRDLIGARQIRSDVLEDLGRTDEAAAERQAVKDAID